MPGIASGLVHTANALTEIRRVAAPVAGIAVAAGAVIDRVTPDRSTVAETYNTALVVGIGALVATDAEGFFIRCAKMIDPTTENPGGGERDHVADKELLRWLYLGLIANRIISGDNEGTAMVGGTLVGNEIRNYDMRRIRELADLHGISTDAILPNKIKTAVQLSTALLSVHRSSREGLPRHASHLGLISGLFLAFLGRNLYREQVNSSIQQAQST